MRAAAPAALSGMTKIAATLLLSTIIAIIVIVAKVAGVGSIAFLISKFFAEFKPSYVTSAALTSTIVFLVCLAISKAMTTLGVSQETSLMSSLRKLRLWIAGLTVSIIPLAALFTQPATSFEFEWGIDYATHLLISTGMLTAYAFSEEVAFRQAFLRRQSSGKAVAYASWVLQAILFWLLHNKSGMLPWEGFCWYFSMGILLGAIYMTLGLTASTIAHTLANISVAQLHHTPTWLPAPIIPYPLEIWFDISLQALSILALCTLLLTAYHAFIKQASQ